MHELRNQTTPFTHASTTYRRYNCGRGLPFMKLQFFTWEMEMITELISCSCWKIKWKGHIKDFAQAQNNHQQQHYSLPCNGQDIKSNMVFFSQYSRNWPGLYWLIARAVQSVTYWVSDKMLWSTWEYVLPYSSKHEPLPVNYRKKCAWIPRKPSGQLWDQWHMEEMEMILNILFGLKDATDWLSN